MRLSSTFNNATKMQATSPLSDEQIMQVAPSIFAVDKHESRSDRYAYIPTSVILQGLRKEGFQPFLVAQSRSRIPGKAEFTKHMLRLRHEDTILSSEAFEIILINSHDGTSSYQLMGGIFRFVCCNGMVIGDSIQDIRVPHRGDIKDNVIEAAYRVVEDTETAQAEIEAMKSVSLTDGEQTALARAALSLKYDDYSPITPQQVLGARRHEDNQNTVWSTYNRLQENMIKGGLHGRTAKGRRTKTRPVNAIDSNVKINKALWILSHEMAKLKG